MATWLSWVARSLVTVGVIAIVLAVVWPVQMSPYMRVGLAALIGGAIVTLTRHHLLRSPLPVRGGRIIEEKSRPIAYRLSFAFAIALFLFIGWVLLYGHQSAP